MIVGNHARVWEYDGAFKCLDCQVHWGALPGHPQMPENCVCSESDQEDVRAQVEGIATLLKASIPPGKDIHGRPSPPSEKPQRCDCGRFPRVHDKGDLCNIGFNEFLGRVQGKLIDMGYEPPLWPEPHIRDCGDVDEALDVCVQWCAARLDDAAQSATAQWRQVPDVHERQVAWIDRDARYVAVVVSGREYILTLPMLPPEKRKA